jgi:hypothetical protein
MTQMGRCTFLIIGPARIEGFQALPYLFVTCLHVDGCVKFGAGDVAGAPMTSSASFSPSLRAPYTSGCLEVVKFQL